MILRPAIAAILALSIAVPTFADEPYFRWGFGKFVYHTSSENPRLILEGARPAYREYGDTEVLVRIDRPAPGTTITVRGLPAGVEFDGAVIAGNPRSSGTYEVTVTLTDDTTAATVDERILSLEVFGMLEAELDGTFEVNSGETVDLLPTVANDLGGGVEWTIDPLPSSVITGLSFDRHTGRIWGAISEEVSYQGFDLRAFDLVDGAEAEVTPFSISASLAAPPDGGPWYVQLNNVLTNAMEATPDGGVIFVGSMPVAGRSTDVVVGKVNESGAIVWITPFGTVGAETVGSIKVLSDGSPVVVGTTDNDMFIARLTASGSLMAGWPKKFGNAAIQRGASLAIAADGSIVAGGRHHTSAYNSSFLFVKVSANGTLDWASHVGNLGIRSADYLTIDDATGAIYAADASGYTIKVNGNGTYDPSFSKEIWATNSPHYLRGIALAPDGGVAIAGNYVTQTFGSSPTSRNNPFIGKFNADGSMAWGRAIIYDAASGSERSMNGMIAKDGKAWAFVSGTSGDPVVSGIVPVDLMSGSAGTPISLAVKSSNVVTSFAFSGGHTYFTGRFSNVGTVMRLPEEVGLYDRVTVRNAPASVANRPVPYNVIANWSWANLTALGLQDAGMSPSGVLVEGVITPLVITP